MKRKPRTQRQPGTAPRGAALLYALIAVLIIAILALGVGRLVSHHAYSEDSSQGYARAIYLAEAAANWQLSRMSRSELPDFNGTPAPGRLRWEQVNTWNEFTHQYEPWTGPLPADQLGVPVEGNVTVWVRNITSTVHWQAPRNFYLFAQGTDPKTGIQRAVQFNGTGTGLADRYALFAQNELLFQSNPLSPIPGNQGVCILKQGYIGSNGRVASDTAGSPPATMPPPSGYFFGCRLGPGARLQPAAGAWTDGWDIPRLPDAVRWPTIDQVVSYCWQGRSVADCATANDNIEIQYRKGDGTFGNFATRPTRLTNSEFDQSGHNPHTIRIKASLTAANNNLIYLTNIRMRPTDVLILDLRKKNSNDDDTGIRILLNNSTLDSNAIDDADKPARITNLAYFFNTSEISGGDAKAQFPSYLWFNNTNQALTYSPGLPEALLAPPPTSEAPGDSHTAQYKYQTTPVLRGLIYGINSVNSATAGDATVEGPAATSVPFPDGIKVNAIVANHIKIIGKVTVLGEPVESAYDPHRYVLYYRVWSRALGEVAPNYLPDSNQPSTGRGPVVDFGPFQ